MPSKSATAVGNAPPSAVDRVLAAMSLWWMATPGVLVAAGIVSATASGTPGEGAGRLLFYACLWGVLVVPVAGLAVTLLARCRRARRRFTFTSAVSLAVFGLGWAFWELAAECPDGYHC